MSAVINIWTAKGGQGGTITAVATAVAASKYASNIGSIGVTGHDVDAIAATFGVGATLQAGSPITDRISVSVGSEDLIIRDRGPIDEGSALEGGLLVTRNCYLALRRAVRLGSGLAGFILTSEPKRALSTTDVKACLSNMPLIALIETDDAIARANDAGLIAQRTPDTLLNVGYAILRASSIETAPELIEA